MARILVIEDERDLQDILAYNLRQAGHEVLQATRGKDGVAICKRERPDLVILDLMLPDMPGTEVCKELQKGAPGARAVPVIMLTAKGEEVDRIVGFEVGASDYVVKPFSMRELLLRVNAVLGRAQRPVSAEGPIVFGVLRIDREAHRVWVAGKEIDLTALEFKLLVTLHERKH